MKHSGLNRKQIAQIKYRSSQKAKGLVRFEWKITKESKARFDAMVEAAADEMDGPWDSRHRLAKARVQIFEKITQGITHKFTALKDEIQALKKEIKVLSPAFSTTDYSDPTSLPDAIRTLPDDPQQLKTYLAKKHHREVLFQRTLNVQKELIKKLKDENHAYKSQVARYHELLDLKGDLST